MANNLAIPRVKLFLFTTTDDPMDSKVEETIRFLAERYGWKEYSAHQLESSVEFGDRAVSIKVRYLVPFEEM